MTGPMDAIATAIARIERESQACDEILQTRIVELEHHADWLQNRVAQLFFLAFLAVAYLLTEQWLGKSIPSLIVAFCVAVGLVTLVMEGWKTPILWRWVAKKLR